MWTEPLLLAKCYLLRLILQLPPTDIICFTVTAWQHESNVDILISCTHGCLAAQAPASELFTPYLCKSGRQAFSLLPKGKLLPSCRVLGLLKAGQPLFLPQELVTSGTVLVGWTGRFTRRVVLKKKKPHLFLIQFNRFPP